MVTELFFDERENWIEAAMQPDEPILSRLDILKAQTEEFISKSCLFGVHQKPMLALLRERRSDWWEKHGHLEAHELAKLLQQYAKERAEKEKRRQEKERRAADPTPAIAVELTLAVSPAVAAVVERTRHDLETGRPESLFREMPLKKKAELSERSRTEYRRAWKQLRKEWDARGVETDWDAAAWLAEVAAKGSRSSYNRMRAIVRRYAAAEKDEGLSAVVQALPPYSELCRLLGREPSRRSSPITEARRAPHNDRVFKKLLGHLSPEYKDVILLLRATGARASEAASIRLEEATAGMKVSITSAKTGSRRRQGSAVRSWVVPTGTPEFEMLAGVYGRLGAQPAEGRSSEAIRSAWRRARTKEGLNTDSGWDLHSLRLDYASVEKKRAVAALEATHGPHWRQKLFGEEWRNSEGFQKAVYGELARRLGHTNAEMTKIYG